MSNITDIREMKARIIVFGVGGAGGNAVNNMITSGLQGVDFIVANTDAQALATSKAKRIIQMGTQVTGGHGERGSRPLRRPCRPADHGGVVRSFPVFYPRSLARRQRAPPRS
jgi:cell division GTPase FtsZ